MHFTGEKSQSCSHPIMFHFVYFTSYFICSNHMVQEEGEFIAYKMTRTLVQYPESYVTLNVTKNLLMEKCMKELLMGTAIKNNGGKLSFLMAIVKTGVCLI